MSPRYPRGVATDHDTRVAQAFDGQAAAFEGAPIQANRELLARLVEFARLPPAARVLDAGCGPGLVAEALLASDPGCTVLGCDLSPVMAERARARCAPAADRCEIVVGPMGAVAEQIAAGRRAPVDAVVSRLVLHHAPDPDVFVADLVRALGPRGPGGILVLADHLADPSPPVAGWHRHLECMRDLTHTRNLTGGELVDLLAAHGLGDVSYEEHPIGTDFEEWFARGTPSATREATRGALLDPAGQRSRAWRPHPMGDGNVWMDGILAYCRGVLP